ncbi:MAG: exonuclease domain-containing protein [Bacteroidales bacterium]|nr:exonuclease domain-containing protein [Bacteroidales bacterium]
MYAIVDVETTGLNPRTEKITEIAIFLHDGTKITHEYTTLINPEKKIPYRITQMTGISNKMVEDAPRFCDVARDILDLTEGRTLVGHHVAFDYSFLRQEYGSLGYDFHREKLCTVRMSRKLIPHRRSYGLGNLCKDLDIVNPCRHRAAGDAMATARLFELLVSIEPAITFISLRGLNSNLRKEIIDELPEQPGVYYFYDDHGNIIYIGKSVNISERVRSHLSDNLSRKEQELKYRIADIGYELTGSELVALLLESSEIKRYQPVFNTSQKRTLQNFGLCSFTDTDGYLQLKISRDENGVMPILTFNSMMAAREFLFQLVEKHELCQKMCGLYKTQHACFAFHVRKCRGACIQKEEPASYNQRVEQAIKPYLFDNENFLIIDTGRTNDEKALVMVENGKYLGFGYVDSGIATSDVEFLRTCIRPFDDNRDARMIIRGYLSRNRVERVVQLQ